MGAMPWYIKRLVLPGLVLVMAGGVVAATLVGGGGGNPESQVIDELIPGEDDTVLLQHRVGVVLEVGWDASLVVNGTPIPEEQHDRTLELGHVFFQPGETKVLQSLQPGENCVTANFWLQASGPEESFARSWCFSAA